MKVFGACSIIILLCLASVTYAQSPEPSAAVATPTATPAPVVTENAAAPETNAATTAVTTAEPAITQTSDASNATAAADSVDKATDKSSKPIKPDRTAYLANIVVGLVFIVALILGVGWFMKRFNHGGMFTNAAAMKIVATLPLGARERLIVVDVSGQQILLGITATQINSLHVFSEPVITVTAPPAQSEFSQKLMSVLQQKKNPSKD